jgi:hypothetical protein
MEIICLTAVIGAAISADGHFVAKVNMIVVMDRIPQA